MSRDNSEHMFLLNRVKHLTKSKPLTPQRWSVSKPYPQCNCSYPAVVYRNMHGHDPSCPVAIAWNTKKVTAQPVAEQLDCAYCDTTKKKGRTNCINCGAPYGRKE